MQNATKGTSTSMRASASGFAVWGGWGLTLAGMLWMMTYLAGVMAGKLIDPNYFDGSATMWLGMIANEAAQICLGTGLLLLSVWLVKPNPIGRLSRVMEKRRRKDKVVATT